MTRWIRWAAVVGAFICIAAPTAQAAEPAPASTALRAVETQSAEIGVATTEAQAARDQRVLKKSVKQAVRSGYGELLMATSKNPSVLADLAKYAKVTEVYSEAATVAKPSAEATGSGQPIIMAETARVRHPRAHSAGCYNNEYDQYVWRTPWGSSIGWLYARENGWCGNGYQITWYGGATFANWAWGPYCITSWHTGYAWDGYPTWIHMAAWGSLGVSYPWGCAGIKGGHATVRIAANGYWDRVDDWGI